jgi:hypothetical protein
LTPQTKREALLRQLDAFIEKHGSKHPELTDELRRLRVEAENAQKRSKLREFADIAFKIGTVLKFIWDHLPPPH